MLQEGERAPRIEATNQDGESVEVSYDRPAVVYFYPEDGTPGCRTEAEQFELEGETYEELGVDVHGVSADDRASHRDFASELDLSFDLLVDPDHEIAEQFGVPVDGNRYDRVTFVVVDGSVHRVYAGVDPEGHAREVLVDLMDDGIVAFD